MVQNLSLEVLVFALGDSPLVEHQVEALKSFDPTVCHGGHPFGPVKQ